MSFPGFFHSAFCNRHNYSECCFACFHTENCLDCKVLWQWVVKSVFILPCAICVFSWRFAFIASRFGNVLQWMPLDCLLSLVLLNVTQLYMLSHDKLPWFQVAMGMNYCYMKGAFMEVVLGKNYFGELKFGMLHWLKII